MSVAGDRVAAIIVGVTDCQARRDDAACRCTAEPTPSPPSLRVTKNNGGGSITLDEL